MAYRVDAPVESMQSSRPNPPGNCLSPEPESHKLLPTDNPMLPLCERGDSGVRSVRLL